MISASFMPMVLKYVMPKITDHIMKVFKLDKMLKYMELPNDADLAAEKALKKCEDMQYEIDAMKQLIKDLDKKI